MRTILLGLLIISACGKDPSRSKNAIIETEQASNQTAAETFPIARCEETPSCAYGCRHYFDSCRATCWQDNRTSVQPRCLDKCDEAYSVCIQNACKEICVTVSATNEMMNSCVSACSKPAP